MLILVAVLLFKDPDPMNPDPDKIKPDPEIA